VTAEDRATRKNLFYVVLRRAPTYMEEGRYLYLCFRSSKAKRTYRIYISERFLIRNHTRKASVAYMSYHTWCDGQRGASYIIIAYKVCYCNICLIMIIRNHTRKASVVHMSYHTWCDSQRGASYIIIANNVRYYNIRLIMIDAMLPRPPDLKRREV
jgi:hypothetical protein